MVSSQGGALPLPATQQMPGKHQHPPPVRPRSKSNFSFRSNKSHKSEGSAGKIDYSKIDLQETHDEKQFKRLQSKADPTLAMSEAEPSAIANSTGSSIAPLRGIQHKDATGNAIVEPDLSNPTRYRWERPLDTIRSFHAAIDGNYNRKSMMRTESSPSMVGGYNNYNSQSRRQSYYGGSNVGSMMNQRPQYEGYHGGRRPDSYYDGNNRHSPMRSEYRPRSHYPRTASDSAFNQGQVYSHGANQHSRETMDSSGGSYAEQAGYYTDPSSENSSLDRGHQDTYGHGGTDYTTQGSRSYQQSMPMIHEGQQPRYIAPAPVQQVARVPIKLGDGTGSGSGSPGVYEPPKAEKGKRKSWLSRRFSTKG